jgi:adenylyl-sulfate kinase
VGRDHAGPSYKKKDGTSFYAPQAAQILAKSLEAQIGITILPSEELVYCERTDSYKEVSKTEVDDRIQQISGTAFRAMLEAKAEIPLWYSYPEVVSVLRSYYNKPVGICYYFVGLSGSGKSTYAEALKGYFEENLHEVTFLDADIIRTHLSKGLGFTKADRSMNVRRIGYVASEIVRHGGIVVVANIAPYLEDRVWNRDLISQHGRYVEIFLDTPLETCMARDVKGLYKAACAGTIANFTGVSDPFEAPTDSIVISPLAKEKLALPLLAYLPSLRIPKKILILCGSPHLIRSLRGCGCVTNHPEGYDSLLYSYPDSVLVKEWAPSRIVYIDSDRPVPVRSSNDLSAHMLSEGRTDDYRAEHRAAWAKVEHCLVWKSKSLEGTEDIGDILTFLTR